MTHSEIIAALGGYREVAAQLGCDRSRAVRWRQDGIPAVRWPAIIKMAADRGLSITADNLLAGMPRSEPAEAA